MGTKANTPWSPRMVAASSASSLLPMSAGIVGRHCGTCTSPHPTAGRELGPHSSRQLSNTPAPLGRIASGLRRRASPTQQSSSTDTWASNCAVWTRRSTTRRLTVQERRPCSFHGQSRHWWEAAARLRRYGVDWYSLPPPKWKCLTVTRTPIGLTRRSSGRHTGSPGLVLSASLHASRAQCPCLWPSFR